MMCNYKANLRTVYTTNSKIGLIIQSLMPNEETAHVLNMMCECFNVMDCLMHFANKKASSSNKSSDDYFLFKF